ncbi:vomeronasal type-1 receptor 4-like [Erinaceus europaeus]|uniref:Vomeronasal type-1 receptor n=1 Tax=Erinaceus europaeus TaxID=9365 RepID=A0A1S2Z9X3_ERIEU|nr:vomeronasal type-1 receptor 4-like [Erinaceus europaeus]
MTVNSSHLDTSRVASRHWAIGVIFSVQTSVGILGNFSLLLHYVSLSLRGLRVRVTDVILRHLTTANSLVILSKGITQTMAALGVRDFLSDVGCKLVFYLHKVGRGVSMGTTCFLSVSQMVTISPWTSRWAELKERTSQNTDYYMTLIWVLHVSVNFVVMIHVNSNLSGKNITRNRYFGYCSVAFQNEITASLLVLLLLLPDVASLGLMLWASSSMVSMLYMHRQRVQHLHRAHVTPRASPESRATQNILVLLSTFVTCYTFSSICHICIAFSKNPSWWMVNISALCAACFPTISPFLLRSPHCRLCGLCWVYMGGTNTPSVMGTV